MALHARPAMRRRPQPHDLWAQGDGAVVLVTRCVMEADQNRHANMATLLNFSDASSRPRQGLCDTPAPMPIRLIEQLVSCATSKMFLARPGRASLKRVRASSTRYGERRAGIQGR